MALVDAVELSGHAAAPPGSTTTRVMGVLAGLGAVALWTWYGLANAAFLKRNPEVSPTGWATVTGLATGLVTLAALPAAIALHQLGTTSGTGSGTRVVALVVGSTVLGVLVSWAATGLWNVASARLPSTSAAMLVNVETLSGYVYVYLALARFPPPGEVMGLAAILTGVVLVVRLRSGPPSTEQPQEASGVVAPGRRQTSATHMS
jgi:drug/metabolite transporter (DMT)-like permease